MNNGSHRKYCAVLNCAVNSGRNPEIKLFNFPRAANINRFMKWAEFSRNPRIINRETTRAYICALHFEDSQYRSPLQDSLLLHAVPTKYFDKTPLKTENVFEHNRHNYVNGLAVSNSKNSPIKSDSNANDYEGSSSSDVVSQFPPYFNHDVDSHDMKKLPDSPSDRLKQNGGPPVTPLTAGKYKIGVTLVKTINKDADVKSLKKSLMDQVDQIFQSFALEIMSDLEKTVSVVNSEDDKGKIISQTAYAAGTAYDHSALPLEYENVHDRDNRENRGCKENIIKVPRNATEEKDNFVTNRNCDVKPAIVNPEYISVSTPVLCSECGLILKSEHSFSNHKRIYHEEKKCEQCTLMVPSLSEYRRHKRKHKRELIRLQKNQIARKFRHCEICNITFTNRMQMRRHKLVLHNVGEYFSCDICNKKCTSSYQLNIHTKNIHKKESVCKVCPYCGRTFASSQCFSTHKSRVHLNIKHQQCSICSKTFKSLSLLKMHIARHTNGIDKVQSEVAKSILDGSFVQKVYPCMICKVKFTDVSVLTSHMNFHEDDYEVKTLCGSDEEGKVQCNVCCRFLKTDKDLAVHRYYFHKEIPFFCKRLDCGLTFWSSWHLHIHNISTHISRSFMCHMCLKTFNNSKAKKKHTLQCQKLFRNKLSFCGKSNEVFTSKSDLKRYTMSSHSSKFVYRCSLCDKAFESESVLSEHIQKHNDNNELCFDPAVSNIMDNVTEEIVIENVEVEHVVAENNLLQYSCLGFQCPECYLFFAEKEHLENHILDFHSKEVELNETVLNL